MSDLLLIYSEKLPTTFEVYDAESKDLLGHISYTIANGHPSDYSFTPLGQPKGQAQSTMLAALKEHFKSEIQLHFPASAA